MSCAELEAMLAKRPDLRVVTIADGAHDNWRYLDALAPRGTAVVDCHHAVEQLKPGLDACHGEGDAKGRAHYEKLRHRLRHDCGGVEKEIRSLAAMGSATATGPGIGASAVSIALPHPVKVVVIARMGIAPLRVTLMIVFLLPHHAPRKLDSIKPALLAHEITWPFPVGADPLPRAMPWISTTTCSTACASTTRRGVSCARITRR